jgi:hypothetical protein
MAWTALYPDLMHASGLKGESTGLRISGAIMAHS